eukprot:6339810-Pyramimonas_sp.AAC.1
MMNHCGRSTEDRKMLALLKGAQCSLYYKYSRTNVVLHDAGALLDLETTPGYIVTRDILHADDNMLVSNRISNLQFMIETLVLEIHKYDMAVNWDKV